MKIKLTPELSYIIGLWRKTKTIEGIGVRGDDILLEVFTMEILNQELTTTDKLLTEHGRVFFYHSSYRKFFQQIEKEQLERFKYLNEYAANYLAGLFDASGTIDEKGIVSIGNLSYQDQMLLLRLGFILRKREMRFIFERPVVFLTFIKKYVKIKKKHKAFDYIKS